MYVSEIRPYWLLVTKGYGFTIDDIDGSCPKDLQPYADAYNLERKDRDFEMWAWWGNYGIPALVFSIEHCLAGKKAKTEYVELPLMASEQDREEKKQRDIIEQRKKLYHDLLEMEKQWKANHPEKAKGDKDS